MAARPKIKITGPGIDAVGENPGAALSKAITLASAKTTPDDSTVYVRLPPNGKIYGHVYRGVGGGITITKLDA